MRRLIGTFCALLFAAPALAPSAHAQTYPERPVTIIVPYAPGGTTDVLARIVAKAMTEKLGQSVIVENAGGAGGTTGTQRVVRSDPNGYTVTVGNMGSLAANVALYPNLSFDPRKDLAPIGLISTIPMVVSASKKSGIKDMAGFLKALRAKEGGVNIGTAGIGSTSHLAAITFQHVTKTKGTLVNYRGSGPSINDLVAGVVDAVFDQTVTMIPMHNGGNVTAIGVSSKERLPQLPDVPTFIEGGVPEFDLAVWNAMMAPKGTPPEIIAKLEAALSASLDDPELQKRFADLAAPVPTAAERGAGPLAKLIARDVDRLGDIVRAAGVKVE